jgi:drug/metabolite transporter (DMT)-like permease
MSTIRTSENASAGIIVELALLLVLSALWGASYTFIKIAVATIPPMTLIAARTLVASAILLVVMHWRGIRLPRDAVTWRRFMLQALFNSVVPFTLIAWAEQSVDAALATILNSCAPIFVFLGTWMITRHEQVTPRKLCGVILGITGSILIIGMEILHGSAKNLIPQLAIVLATLCYAAAAIYGKNFKNLDPMQPAAGSLLCGVAVMIPLSLALDHPWTIAPSSTSIFALLGLSVFSTALAFVIYFRLVRTLGSVGTSAQTYLRVPIGVAISVIFLHETPTTTVWAGLACIVIGVAAMTIPQRIKLD